MRECPPFTCAICERYQENRWPGAIQTWPIAPVCHYCETIWGGQPAPVGAFRDRRIIRQIDALANALSAFANHKHYRSTYAPA